MTPGRDVERALVGAAGSASGTRNAVLKLAYALPRSPDRWLRATSGLAALSVRVGLLPAAASSAWILTMSPAHSRRGRRYGRRSVRGAAGAAYRCACCDDGRPFAPTPGRWIERRRTRSRAPTATASSPTVHNGYRPPSDDLGRATHRRRPHSDCVVMELRLEEQRAEPIRRPRACPEPLAPIPLPRAVP